MNDTDNKLNFTLLKGALNDARCICDPIEFMIRQQALLLQMAYYITQKDRSLYEDSDLGKGKPKRISKEKTLGSKDKKTDRRKKLEEIKEKRK